MMVFEQQQQQPMKKLNDFFTLDNVQNRTALDCRSLPGFSLGTSAKATTDLAFSFESSAAAPSASSRPSTGRVRRPVPTSSKAFNASMPNLKFDMDDESDSDFSDIEWSKHNNNDSNNGKRRVPRNRSLKNMLERKGTMRASVSDDDILHACRRASAARSTASLSADSSVPEKKKRLLKVRASDVSKLPSKLRDSITSRSTEFNSADDQSCSVSVLSKAATLAPSKRDSDRAKSISRRQTMEHAAAPPPPPPVRGVLRQRSMDGSTIVSAPRRPNINAARRQQSMSAAAAAATASLSMPASSSQAAAKSRGRSVGRSGATGLPTLVNRARSTSRAGTALRSGPVSSDNNNQEPPSPSPTPGKSRERSLKHSKLFMSNVLTERLWASADNLNYVPDSFDDLMSRSDHGDDGTTMTQTSPRRGLRRSQSVDDIMPVNGVPRRGIRRSRSIKTADNFGHEIPNKQIGTEKLVEAPLHSASTPDSSAVKARRCRSVDCRRNDIVTPPPPNKSSPSPPSLKKQDVAPRKPRSKSTNHATQSLKPEKRSSSNRKCRADGSWRTCDQGTSSQSGVPKEQSSNPTRSRSRVPRPSAREDDIVASITEQKERSRSSKSHRSDGSKRQSSSRSGGEEEKLAARASRSKSRSDRSGSRSKSKSVAECRDKSRDGKRVVRQKSKSSPSDDKPKSTSPIASERRSKSRSRSSTSLENISKNEVSKSDPAVDILRALADAADLDISPRKRLHRHLGKHHKSPTKKSGDGGSSLTSGSTVSKTSRVSNGSHGTSSTSSSTYEATELTPGAISRIQDLGITQEQLALLKNMGLTISERTPN